MPCTTDSMPTAGQEQRRSWQHLPEEQHDGYEQLPADDGAESADKPAGSLGNKAAAGQAGETRVKQAAWKILELLQAHSEPMKEAQIRCKVSQSELGNLLFALKG